MNLLIIRLLIFAVLFYAGLKLYSLYRQHKLSQQKRPPERVEGGAMVRCRWCDVHVPESEALRFEEKWFCSSAHRECYIQEQKDRDPS
ncbi:MULTISPECIES: PP0621 family protein [unclassified Halomonas]|uniref:PP0621 family protein n=1 Tax=unclassified Halomonas TaxID=2609666 RepID=UPI00209F39D2|nr:MULTISPECIES: PP0621 family protein [unclassified Halomonas]MCP1313739.1 HTTM domain-containing protein [Halomonas sp. 707D7]MCP1327724.1 HTTM domain-containing protein [Halomonas sp. 707D4]